jgi:hypothetical protein
MKGILRACLLISAQAMTVAQAYEADIHYSTTYALARAVGWSEADARIIASANQGVDENEDTVAALEVEAIPGPTVAGYVMSSIRQAEKNLRFHCFSKAPDQGTRISADVRQVITNHFGGVPAHREDPRSHARRLIALGVALHCQQDAHSHVGFGGSCGSHSGSCHGHTYETFLDQVVFGLLKKHYFNPDHPGVSGERLLETLRGTVRELAARRPGAASRSIPTSELVALSDELRRSGLDLPDEVRRDCNRYIAGKWLFEFLHSDGRQQDSRRYTAERLAPRVAVACRNASLASATAIRIPDPRFPRLNSDASPYLVKADGTYQLVRDGDFDDFSPGPRPVVLPGHQTRQFKVQLSHWSQLLALPPMDTQRLGCAQSSLSRCTSRLR